MGKLEGRVALVTGGGSGIGRATAILFADEGAKVAVADISPEGGKETVKMIKAAGGKATFIEADVSRSKDIENMFKKAISTYGQLDALFNNAGIEQSPTASPHLLSEEVWDSVISINLKGVFLGMKYGAPYMFGRGGTIVNTASVAGVVGVSYIPAYCASKGGVVMLTKSAALDYASQNVRVNCVCPGYIDTPLHQRARLERTGPEWQGKVPFRSPSPIERKGTAEEVARAVLFLSCDESSYITGSALIIDGGMSTQ